MLVPSVLAAVRMLLPSGVSVSAVVVSIWPLASTRPTTRFTTAVVSVDGSVPPKSTSASYPVNNRYSPFTERVIKPSKPEAAATRRLFAPLAVVGNAIDWTGGLAGTAVVENSSRKTGTAPLIAALPLPTR